MYFCCSNHQVNGILLWQPRQTRTHGGRHGFYSTSSEVETFVGLLYDLSCFNGITLAALLRMYGRKVRKRSRRLNKEFTGYIVVAVFTVIAMEVVKSRHWGYSCLLKCSPKYQIYFECRSKELMIHLLWGLKEIKLFFTLGNTELKPKSIKVIILFLILNSVFI